MADERATRGWWHTIPGILTASSAAISAIAGLIVALQQAGMFDRDGQPDMAAVEISESAVSEVVATSSETPATVPTGAASPPATVGEATAPITTALTTSALIATRPETASGNGASAEVLARARSVLREEGPSPAARLFADALRGDPSYTIVVRDNCDSSTLRQAIFIIPTSESIVLPLPGSGCFRVGWGLFATEAEARAVLPRVLSRIRQQNLAEDGRVELVAAVLR